MLGVLEINYVGLQFRERIPRPERGLDGSGRGERAPGTIATEGPNTMLNLDSIADRHEGRCIF
jgi:hypothetical protein